MTLLKRLQVLILLVVTACAGEAAVSPASRLVPETRAVSVSSTPQPSPIPATPTARQLATEFTRTSQPSPIPVAPTGREPATELTFTPQPSPILSTPTVQQPAKDLTFTPQPSPISATPTVQQPATELTFTPQPSPIPATPTAQQPTTEFTSLVPTETVTQEQVIMYEINEDSTSETLLEALKHSDSHVRAKAAGLLWRMNHPRALEACLQTLNDGEDELHLDITPAVWCLTEIGEPALLPLMDYLLDADMITRLRAQRAVEGITAKMFGLENGKWPEDQLKIWRNWWMDMGYAYDAESAMRERGVEQMAEWIMNE